MSQYSVMDVEVAWDVLTRRGYERAAVQTRERSRAVLRRVAQDFKTLAADNSTDAALYLRQKALEFDNLCDNTEQEDKPASVWNWNAGTWSVEMSTLEGVGFVSEDVNGKFVITPEGMYHMNLFDRDTDSDGDVKCWLYEDKNSVKFVIFND